MISDVLAWLDQHGGAVVAISTVFYTVMTLLLLIESRSERRQRREALVEVFPLRHTEAGGAVVELRVENFGPGIAREVECEYWFADGTRAIESSRMKNGAAALGPGLRFRALPGLDAPTEAVDVLASRGLRLVARWKWSDDGRGRLRAPHTVRRKRAWEMALLKSQSEWLLLDHEISENLGRVADAAEAVQAGRRDG